MFNYSLTRLIGTKMGKKALTINNHANHLFTLWEIINLVQNIRIKVMRCGIIMLLALYPQVRKLCTSLSRRHTWCVREYEGDTSRMSLSKIVCKL